MSAKSTRYRVFTALINPAAVAAGTVAEQTFGPLPGFFTQIGDRVYVNKPSHTPGLAVVNARTSAVNAPDNTSIMIAFCNPTAAPIDPPEELYTIAVIGGGIT